MDLPDPAMDQQTTDPFSPVNPLVNRTIANGSLPVRDTPHPTGTDAKLAALRVLLTTIDVQEAMRRRAVQDAITNALPAQWEQRAETFEWVAGHPFDDPLDADPAAWDQSTVEGRSRASALDCRRHAWLLREMQGDPLHVSHALDVVLDQMQQQMEVAA